MGDIEDINSIQIFVDAFYAKVKKDALLGPVFADAIEGDWQPHLNRMYQFWNAALFSVPGFKGNPFAKHAPLSIQPQHFERWLQLFSETINDLFSGPVATDAIHRARLMGTLFQAKLGMLDNNFSKVIV